MLAAASALGRNDERDTFGLHRADALLVGLSGLQGALLLLVPAAPIVALGLWWNANSVSHNFIHRPFFRSRKLSLLYSLYLSLLLGLPQTMWRTRHLAHHAGVAPRLRWSPRLAAESLAVIALWAGLIAFSPAFFFKAYFPGWLAGLCLCQLHGYYEHARGTVSHYGALYNFIFFNDGYHVEHHARPGTHWTELPYHRITGTPESSWPAVFRWLEALSVPKALGFLERSILGSPRAQRFVVGRHERAFARLMPELSKAKRIGIVGGALFPRTAIVLGRLLPSAELVVIDGNRENVELAKQRSDAKIVFVEEWFTPERHGDFDAVVIPLALEGDRESLYASPPAPLVVVHDWIWRRRGEKSAVVSWLLLKRLNLVLR